MIPVKVANLSISNMGFVVLLKANDDERTLPIFIGVPEAQAIALQLNNVDPPRPMTHDLMKNLLDVLEGRLDHVEICDIDNGTFFGKLVLTFEGQRLEVDSRPSDAIALSLRCNAQIFVAQNVMTEAGVVIGEDEKNEKLHSPENESEQDKLQHALEKAIKEERYEDAAKLRDQIKNYHQSN